MVQYMIIKKSRSGRVTVPNLMDYDTLRSSFSWDTARRELEGSPGGGLNIAHEAVDRHAQGPKSNQVALLWIDKAGQAHDFTYARLQVLSNRFANVLRELGVGKGERVFVLAPRIPELYIAALGTLKNRSVFCPLFSAFGPEPICARMAIGEAKVLVTTDTLYHRKIEQLRERLPQLEHVLLVNEQGETTSVADTYDFHHLLDAADTHYTIAHTDPEDMALLHFTSGTTGEPKAAIHVHGAVTAHYVTAKFALDLHPDDIFWCTADPGWVTGTSYGIVAPLTIGATLLVDREEFEVERWYRILQDHKVSVWYTAPTAIRMMMKFGTELPHKYDFSRLRFLASVGEPLNPDAVLWGVKAFALPFHDNWWQTETGGIMIANNAAMDIKPGSMGRPLPGIEAAIVRHSDDGQVMVLDEPDQEGELALRTGWPSMFRGYLGEDERYQKCFVGDWYLSGDLAKRDEDGYFWFVGRVDDVIKSSGHLIGPFEVESALMEHPAVLEVGVIGKPDPLAMEVVKAFVVLKPDYVANEVLRRELLAHARKRLGAAMAPKEIEFRNNLPKTYSGKILRRLLKEQEMDA